MSKHPVSVKNDTFRVFLACPITALLHPEKGNLPSTYERYIRDLHQLCLAASDSVFLALEREAWGANLMTANVCTPLDYKEMLACDAVVAYPGASSGVAVELGWASALRKPIILILDEGAAYTPMITGLNTLPNLYVRTLHIQKDGAVWNLADIAGDVRALLADIRQMQRSTEREIAV